jgi:hypothetical protein
MTLASTPHESPARGRVESLAYPRITATQTALMAGVRVPPSRYSAAAPAAGTAATANPCAWTGTPVISGR